MLCQPFAKSTNVKRAFRCTAPALWNTQLKTVLDSDFVTFLNVSYRLSSSLRLSLTSTLPVPMSLSYDLMIIIMIIVCAWVLISAALCPGSGVKKHICTACEVLKFCVNVALPGRFIGSMTDSFSLPCPTTRSIHTPELTEWLPCASSRSTFQVMPLPSCLPFSMWNCFPLTIIALNSHTMTTRITVIVSC